MGKKAAAPPPPPDPVEEETKVEEEPPIEVLEGDFQLADGSSYSGEYIVKQEHPLMHGKGRLLTWPESFEGSFCEGLYKQGVFKGADGSVYSGSFHNNLFHGPGEYKWSDGRAYRGMWQEGLMHGRGEFENFSFGVDRLFEGFSVCGKFLSSLKGQEEAKRGFLAEYVDAYNNSAKAALQDIASKVSPPEPADPKAKKGAPPPEEAAFEWPKEYMVPPEPENDDPSEEREQVLEVVAGPFPDGTTLKPAAVITFAGFFTEGAAEPGQVTLLEERGQPLDGFDGGRLKKEQLDYVGQGVALSIATPEPGALKLLVLVNVSPEYHVSSARWKLVYAEEEPVPVEETPAAAPEKEVKGKKK